mmetsp:Transcript_17842/g.40937  ORF Transcript_17842/g.40937 Transcript_17842/m.40937 type:complete len:293 (-) Transcript_17842:87-965(-)
MTSKGRQNTECQPNRKENLAASHAPDFSPSAQDTHVPNSNVFLHSVAGSLECQGLAEKDEEKDNGKSHSKVGNASCPLDPPGYTQKDDEPSHECETDIASDHASCLESVSGGEANDLVEKVICGFLAGQIFFAPWSIGTPRRKESIGHPRNQYNVVSIEHETTCNGSKSNASQARMKGSKDSNVTGLKVLSKTDFQNGERNTQQAKGHDVGNEESTTTILDSESGESPNVSKSHGSTDCGHVKGKSRRPFSSILRFVQLERETAFSCICCNSYFFSFCRFRHGGFSLWRSKR